MEKTFLIFSIKKNKKNIDLFDITKVYLSKKKNEKITPMIDNRYTYYILNIRTLLNI